MMPYQKLPTTTTTMKYSLSKVRMIAIFAGMMLLLICGASSTYDVTPRRVSNKQSKKTTKPLVTKPLQHDGAPCLPAQGYFGGITKTTTFGNYDPFETCYKLNAHTLCWTKSYLRGGEGSQEAHRYFQCVPNGAGWYALERASFNSCGSPCQGQHQD